jgi:hypothetical protein
VQHKIAPYIFLLLSANNLYGDTPMTNQLLAITATCKGNKQCLFDGQDMFLDIKITNNQPINIGFPLEFLQQSGPIIRLIDNRTKAESYLKKNLADLALQNQFTQIKPGGSVILEWVIFSNEIQQFSSQHLDLTAEITVMTEIFINGKKVEYLGTETLRILNKQTVY